MNKIKCFLAIVISILFFAEFAVAAGSCVQSAVASRSGMVKIKFVCTGDAVNGSIPATAFNDANMAIIRDTHYLYSATAYPTSGGTAPDAADVTVTMNGGDLLGAKGVNLIHATATQDTMPYSAFMTSYRFPRITDTLTLGVANQATASANYTIDFIFDR